MYHDKDVMEPLLNSSQRPEVIVIDQFGAWYNLKRYLGCTISKEQRVLRLNGSTLPRSFCSNKLNNQKYNVLTFVPLVLLNEFKFFFNMFFLLIALSQFVPALKVGKLFLLYLRFRFSLHIYRTTCLCAVSHYVQRSF